MNETINDIIREMREDWAITYFSEGTKKKNGDYSNVAAIGSQTVAERIGAAYKREMLRMESLLQKAGETVVGLMNKASAQSAEIAKLRAALKPVLELQNEFGWELAFQASAADAVRESQRIYKEVRDGD